MCFFLLFYPIPRVTFVHFCSLLFTFIHLSGEKSFLLTVGYSASSWSLRYPVESWGLVRQVGPSSFLMLATRWFYFSDGFPGHQLFTMNLTRLGLMHYESLFATLLPLFFQTAPALRDFAETYKKNIYSKTLNLDSTIHT